MIEPRAEPSCLRITACLIQLQEIADLQKELAAEAAANEAKRIAEVEALAREQEEMRLTLAQLDPEMLELAAPEVKNAQKLERRAEAVDVVFDMCAKVPRLQLLQLAVLIAAQALVQRLCAAPDLGKGAGLNMPGGPLVCACILQVQKACRGPSCRARGGGCCRSGGCVGGRAWSQRWPRQCPGVPQSLIGNRKYRYIPHVGSTLECFRAGLNQAAAALLPPLP